MSTNPPRAVFVTRESDYQLLLARHATREQARFFLETRGQSLELLEDRHSRFTSALQTVRAEVPADWRQTTVSRNDFDRFLFGPEDIVIAVGQDGLVANVSKYLSGQPVIGVNPDPTQYDGVLVRFAPQDMADLLPAVGQGRFDVEPLTMADATFEPLNLPAWSTSLVLWLLFLGFPVAVFLAWALEVTPDGIKRTVPRRTPVAASKPA